MPRTTNLTGVITLASKQIAITEQIAIREKVNLVLTGYGTAGAADLLIAIVHDGALMAILQGLTDYTTYIGGVLNLNTEEIVAVFDNMSANAKVKMSIVIWDLTNECTLVNDFLLIQNNPYNSSMDDPTPVDPITPGTYALIANGVTNGDSHTHQNGDGASLDPYYIRRSQTGAFFKQSSDGLDLMLRDRLTGEWRALILYNSAISLGPAE